MPKWPKITSLLFLCNILIKNWVMKLIFCTQICMKACNKYDLVRSYDRAIVWSWWEWSSIAKVPKVARLQCLYKISKKKSKMKLIFRMQINIKISTLWASKFPARLILSLLMGMIKHSWNTRSNKFGNKVIFGMQINDKVFTNCYYPFWWKWPDVFKTPKIGSW